jgi:type I restriction enzyme S subunit
LAGDWREVLLDDVAEDVTVGHVGPMASEYVTDGIPFLRSLNVEPLRVNDSDLKFISPEFHSRLKKSSLRPGDVVIVRTGKPGACAVIPDSVPVANCSDLVIVRCGPELDARFLAYYVNSVAAHHVGSHLVGAVQQHFNVGAARKIVIHLPTLDEQRAIAHILGTLDDKIELNRRMSETLESIARALFQSWFVDFDPVRAKSEGRDTGLPKHIANLFPDGFEESELGEIPKGWRVESIGDLADIVGGSTPSTKEPSYWDGGIHNWATPKDLSDLSVPVLLDTERRISDAGLEHISSGLLPVGTVLLSSRAPIGYLAIAEVPLAINQGFIAMRPKAGVSNLFLLLWAHVARELIVSRANGSTFLEISKSNFRPISLSSPPERLLNAFDTRVRPLYKRIVECERESRSLTALRDRLLPDLITGEFRVRDAERFTSANG